MVWVMDEGNDNVRIEMGNTKMSAIQTDRKRPEIIKKEDGWLLVRRNGECRYLSWNESAIWETFKRGPKDYREDMALYEKEQEKAKANSGTCGTMVDSYK